MITIERRRYFFKTKEILFSESIHDVSNCHGVTFSGIKHKVDLQGFTRTDKFTSVIDLTRDLDDIWNNMDKKSCRYAIKRAERDGVVVKISQDFSEFYSIFKAFVKERQVPGIMDNITTIRKYGTLFLMESKGEVLGGNVYLEDSNTIVYWVSATKRLEADKEKKILIGNASHLAQWEAIKYAKEKKEFENSTSVG